MGGDVPLAGDWNGDGCDTIAIYRPSEGKVYIRNTLGQGVAESSFYFGDPGDKPYAGDFDGDGISTVGLYRDTTGYTYQRNSNTQGVADLDFFYGVPSDRILAGDWTADGKDTVAIFRPDEGRFYLSHANRLGPADEERAFGDHDWIPLAGNFSIAGAPTIDPGSALLWSDPATWPEGTVPAAGDVVTIPPGHVVMLDVPPPALDGVNVNGSLLFADEDLTLITDWMIVRGALQIGTETEPHAARAEIVLTGTPDQDIMGMGNRLLGVTGGGVLDLHGTATVSWTHLVQHADIGATQIRLAEPVDWKPGQRIVISSTDFDWEQFEERTITWVDGPVVGFAEPLEHPHFGQIQSFGGQDLDERAQVALLDRNIEVRGDGPGIDEGFGGHSMFMAGSTVRIEYAEFFSMGQAGVMGRYPLHWHLAGDVAGSYIKGVSIHHSHSRCVTIHGASNALVADTVGHDTMGHCFFLEDGSERNNTLERNLGLATRRPSDQMQLIPSDDDPATFWITNPDNILRDNVAAGSEHTGIWYALPEHPLDDTGSELPIRHLPLGEFSNNVAHSNYQGVFIDNGPDPDGHTDSTNYRPRTIPTDPDSPPAVAVFEGVTAYKNRGRGLWSRGDDHLFTNVVLADNGVGASFAARDTGIDGGLMVGESDNLGHPRHWEDTGPDGRSLPAPWKPEAPIRGFDFYDGPTFARNVHFAEFEGRAQRPAGALAVLNYTDFTLDFRNEASGLSFAPDTNRVFLESRALPTDRDNGEDGYRSAVFQDVDGTTTGTAGVAVVVNNPVLVDGDCVFRTEWGAWVCDNEYLRLGIADRANAGVGNLTITRDDGATHTMLGRPNDATRFSSSLLTSRTYTVSGAWSGHMQFRTHDSAVPLHLVIDGWWGEVFGYRDWWIDERNRLQEVGSMGELLAGDGHQFYRSGGQIHLLLTQQDERDYAAIELCTVQGCY